MVAAARTHNVRLMTAYRLHFERANLGTLALVRAGKLGQPRFITASFSMQVAAGNVRLQPAAAGGGPLYDLGVYCINAARHLFAAEPIAVSAFAANDGEPRFADTHEMMSCLLRFPDQRLASFTVSAGATDTSWYEIVGSRGRIRMDRAYELAAPLVRTVEVDGRITRSRYPKRDQFAPELLHFSTAVLSGKEPVPSGEEGLADVRVVTALLESARRGQTIELEPQALAAQPSLRLERRRPPIARPTLIDAENPNA